MKKTLIPLLIGLVSASIVDLSLALINQTSTMIATFVSYLFTSFLFSSQIKERPFQNSVVIFIPLFFLLVFAFLANSGAYQIWITILICAIVAYPAGFQLKRIFKKQ